MYPRGLVNSAINPTLFSMKNFGQYIEICMAGAHSSSYHESCRHADEQISIIIYPLDRVNSGLNVFL